MKKISLLLAVLMILASFTAISVSADAFGVTPNPDVNMPNAAPTIDGKITAGEGWSSPAKFDIDTTAPFWRFNALVTNGDIYFAYTEEGFYFATNFTTVDHFDGFDQNGKPETYDGNTFIYSTGLDNINPSIDEEASKTEYIYGFNGDVVSLMLDPAGLFIEKGYTGNTDFTAWYNVGVFEDGTAKMYRSRVNEGYVNEAQVAGLANEANTEEGTTGWTVEAFIPWTVIAQDLSDMTFGDIELTPEELSAVGYKFNAAILLQDRFYDVEAGIVDTWGRWITVCDRTFDGVPGQVTCGDAAKCLGIKLVNGTNNPFKDVPENDWFTTAALWCNANGYITGTSKDTFSPNMNLSRAQFVRILASVAKVDLNKVTYTAKFKDVPDGQWYTKAILWAADNGVTGGIGNGLFGTNDPVTREQLAAFLYKFAQNSKIDVSKTANITSYSDYSKVSTWAQTAMAWAVNAKLISSTSSTVKTLAPSGIATRAQASVIVKALCENVLSK